MTMRPETTRRLRRAALLLPCTVLLVACAISRQQEREMGADYASQLEAKIPIIQDPELNRYLAVLGDSVARGAGVNDATWSFRLVNSQEVNAYSIAGGYVYVTRGLVARTTKMNQLAGVLGHEIGHVARRHMVKQMQQARRADVAVTLGCVLTGVCGTQAAQAGIDVAGGALMASYSREDETEADVDAVHLLVQAGIDPRGIPELFQVLIDERRSQPRGVAAWFATHPTEENRIARTREEIAKVPAGRLDRLRVSSSAFDRFRERLGHMPLPPRS